MVLPNKIVSIAGATGFVGTAIRNSIVQNYTVRGLTRSAYKMRHPDPSDPVQWIHCDAYALDSVTKALAGTDILIYLIHSMVPSSRLTQASFQNLDLLIADNFAKAAKVVGVKRIIYVGGLMPDEEGETSDHLSSRFEVEQVLQATGIPVTTLRCGMIIGPGGSSLKILINLVRRLPVMGLPSWSSSQTQPIAIQDVLRAVHLCLEYPEIYTGSFDIGGPERLTYRDLIEITAEEMGKKRLMFLLPFINVVFSKRWVSTFSSSSLDLVGPLIDSLRHTMVVDENPLQEQLKANAVSFREAVSASMDDKGFPLQNPRRKLRRADQHIIREQRRVRSVQRLPLPPNKDAHWTVEEYVRWLPQFLWLVLRCRVEGRRILFFFRFLSTPLLELTIREGGTAHHTVLDITDGLLANVEESPEGRFEFREVFNGTFVIAAIHEFCPRLPWLIYNSSQALVHLMVMRAFGRHLKSLST
ncbi:MAG: nucleoside-diphosphate sugar epimerase [Deltaproteobacteria bacterium]|nr:nucleoside-diphosphate sugar epimerase [Deltaproteobacteria bacterium]